MVLTLKKGKLKELVCGRKKEKKDDDDEEEKDEENILNYNTSKLFKNA